MRQKKGKKQEFSKKYKKGQNKKNGENGTKWKIEESTKNWMVRIWGIFEANNFLILAKLDKKCKMKKMGKKKGQKRYNNLGHPFRYLHSVFR